MGRSLATSRKSDFFFILFIIVLLNLCYQPQAFKASSWISGNYQLNQINGAIRKIVAVGFLIPCLSLNPVNHPPVVFAAQQVEVSPNDLKRLKLGLREIDYLLANWEDKTTYCNFGEFQRELLLPENKAKLMDAAKEFTLWDYDKTKTMNVMCKRDPQVIMKRKFLHHLEYA